MLSQSREETLIEYILFSPNLDIFILPMGKMNQGLKNIIHIRL